MKLKDNHIVLSKRNSTKNNQTFTVVGQVTDEKGMPLIGVNITAKGHGNTVTDIDGNYFYQSRTGYRSCVFLYRISAMNRSKVNKQKTVNVQMTEDTKALNEVVVIGYGTQEKSQSDRSCRCHIFERIEDRPFLPRSSPRKEPSPNLQLYTY